MLGSVDLFISEYSRIDTESRASSLKIDPTLSYDDRRDEGWSLLKDISLLVGEVVCIALRHKMMTATYPFYVMMCMSLLQAREYVKLPQDKAALHFCNQLAVLDGEFVNTDTASILSSEATHFFGEISTGAYNQQHPACVIEIVICLGDEDDSGVDSTVFTCFMPMKPQREGEYLFPSYEEDPAKFKAIVHKMAPKVAQGCSGSDERWAEVSSLIGDDLSSVKSMKLAKLEGKLQGNLLTEHGVWESANKKRLQMIRQCWGCGLRQFILKKCSRCLKVWYCGAECQKKHWKLHKKVCTPHQ